MPDFIRIREKDQHTESKQIAVSNKTRETVRRMVVDGVPLEKIARMMQMDIKVIQELAATVGSGCGGGR